MPIASSLQLSRDMLPSPLPRSCEGLCRGIGEPRRSANTPMNAKFVINFLLLMGFLITQLQLLAQEKSRYILPDDPTKAWAEVEKVHQALRPPDEWRTHEPTAEQVAQFLTKPASLSSGFPRTRMSETLALRLSMH